MRIIKEYTNKKSIFIWNNYNKFNNFEFQFVSASSLQRYGFGNNKTTLDVT